MRLLASGLRFDHASRRLIQAHRRISSQATQGGLRSSIVLYIAVSIEVRRRARDGGSLPPNSRCRRRLACRPDITMQLPYAAVILPHDNVLALVGNGVIGSKKSVSANLDRRIVVNLRLNRFQAFALEAPVDYTLPKCVDGRRATHEVAVRR